MMVARSGGAEEVEHGWMETERWGVDRKEATVGPDHDVRC